jgi:hypothetical protein
VLNTAFVTSLLHQTVANFGIVEVTSKAGELTTIAVEMFLKSLLTRVIESARLRRICECTENEQEHENSSFTSINIFDLLAASEENPRILGLNGSAFALLEQIRIQASSSTLEFGDSYLEG